MLGNKVRWGIAAGVVIVAIIVLVFGRPEPTTTNTATDTSRAAYAADYDLLWRQDSGQSAVLVTATMFPPFLRSDLGQAGSKTSEEDQIWSTMEQLPATTVPVFLTFDSVSGSLSDATISKSLSLTTDKGTTLHLVSWKPLVGNSHIVNAASGAASQIGVALFSADGAIDWNSPPQFTLQVTGIAGQTSRTFVWTRAALQAPHS